MATPNIAPDASHAAVELPHETRDSEMSAFLRAQNEDDDGYDPYSDRPASREPLFEPDPWA